MWLTLLFGLVNACLSYLGNRMVRFSGFDIAPAGIIILASRGEGVLFPALVLTASYSIVSPKELRYLWLTLPLTILIGYLSFVVPYPAALIVLYHLIGFAFAYNLGYFGASYVMFMAINGGLNLAVAHAYALIG